MVKNSLVTKKQALALKELKFNELTLYLRGGVPVPTVDEVIDWLRRKYDIIIYNKIPPFVDPMDCTHKTILFRYGIKRCDTIVLGWNGRVDLGSTDMSTNVYALKRAAINIALKYIKSQKNAKIRLTRNAKCF